jgi:hypothetical protein
MFCGIYEMVTAIEYILSKFQNIIKQIEDEGEDEGEDEDEPA